MHEIELKILQKIAEICQPLPHQYVGDDKIAKALDMSPQDVSDFLHMMKEDGLVKLAESCDGCGAELTAKGRLWLTHPDYMFSKGYGDARDVLKAIEMAVNDSENIPPQKKDSLTEPLKNLYHDPYVQSISSGLVVECLKKIFSF